MSSHVTEWLNAYLDGELKGGRLHQVEAHLAECEVCRAELRSLQNLSSLLHEVPAPEFISPERFAAQVSLRLPHEQPRAAKGKAQEIGWWMIPVSLVVLWVFVSTSALVSDVILTAERLGMLGGAPNWLMPGAFHGAFWSGTLGEFGLLSGNGLQWAELTETFTRNQLSQFIWQASIALMYLGWIAVWWARTMRRGSNRFLEG